VRAAVIRDGGPSTLVAFDQAPLPAGAVRAGVVEDPQAVGQAVAGLRSRLGFGSRTVRVGVSNLKLVTRTLELPALPRDEIMGAIRYHAQDQIPLPLEDAIVDFQVVEEFTSEDGHPLLHVLVVAAQRQMIDDLVDALALGGVEPSRIEPSVWALLRATPGNDTEAVVDVGGSLTTVMVHLGSKIRFVRTLGTGGDDFTKALQEAAALHPHDAERLKRKSVRALERRLASSDSERMQRPRVPETKAAEVLAPMARRLVDEIRGSLDYYSAQSDASLIDRVRLFGGGSLLGGFKQRLRSAVGVEVVRAAPASGLKLGKDVDDVQLDDQEPFLGVAIGLASSSSEGEGR
jgi:type IV pilus assembly protein PilM